MLHLDQIGPVQQTNESERIKDALPSAQLAIARMWIVNSA
jgi:hypothetical protein